MTYQAEETLREALQRYYESNGLPADGGVSDKWARYKLGPVNAIAFPNFAHRNKAILRHDAHHILNNLDTSTIGEGLIAAWELGSGCGKFWISWFMESQALWWGIMFAPRQTLKWFAIGRHSRNYFHDEFDRSLLEQKVGSLRAQMLPGHSNLRLNPADFLRLGAVSLLGIVCVVIFTPIVTFFTIFGKIIGADKILHVQN